MNNKSEILDIIGLGNIDIAYFFIILTVLILILLVLFIIQMVKLNKLKKKYQKFMRGKDAKSLEKEIVELYEDNQFLKEIAKENNENITKLYKKQKSNFQKCGIIKYDAFKQMGGKLSFSLALLNETNDGFIINSVHSSDGCYSYTKEIVNGECSISLGGEEKEALDKAIGDKNRK